MQREIWARREKKVKGSFFVLLDFFLARGPWPLFKSANFFNFTLILRSYLAKSNYMN